jgi:hypothetical protein
MFERRNRNYAIGIQEVTDERILELYDFVCKLTSLGDSPDIRRFGRDDVYMGSVALIDPYFLDEYFGDQTLVDEEKIVDVLPASPARSGLVPSTLGFGFYAKRFDNGTVHFLEHGEEWSSFPGRAWAVFGHARLRDEKRTSKPNLLRRARAHQYPDLY